MKKRSFAVLFAIAVMLSLVSCGTFGGGTGDSDSVTLTLMGKKTDLEKSYMASILEQYEKLTGNKLDIIAIEDSEFEETAAEEIADGNVPDILMHFHNTDLDRFDVENNFYYMNDEEWVDDLTDSARAYCEDKEGNLLGLPFWESSVSGCYYNKTILDSMGLKPAATQEEFDMLCQALADTGFTPICWPGDGCSWMPQFALDPIFADNDELLEKLNKNEVTYAEIPAVTEMLQWLSDAGRKGWFGKNYMKCGWSDISSELGSGDAVMTFIWDTWFYTDFEDGQKYSKEDFALMPVFMNTAPDGTYEGGNLNMMMANKNGEHLEEALDFLSFCATPENYNTAFDGISTVNCFKGQNTNIKSQMVVDAEQSIAAYERVSTASTRIAGYSADDVIVIVNDLIQGKSDVANSVKLLDESRINDAKNEEAEGF